jgi:GTP-binding protein Era
MPDDTRPLPVPAPSAVPSLQQQVAARWELAAGEVQAALRQTVAIAFLGSASSGKDSAIKALFGLDFGQIDPIPGSTSRVRVAPVDADRQVLVVNAPGFGDLRADVQAQAERVLDSLDLAIYVVNCDGGATIDEKRDLDKVRALGRPTLVCLNKIDLIRPNQREYFVKSTLVQLGIGEDMAVVTAFDPLPQLADGPIGVERVITWVWSHLNDGGKGLLFAKNLRNKVAACEPIIQAAAQRAALAGAIPIPGADATAVTAVQVKLVTDLAAVFGRRMDKELVLFILGEALAGTSKGFIRWGIEAAKAAGWLPGGQVLTVAISGIGAVIAGATTYGVGRAAVLFLQRDGKVSGNELRDVFDAGAFEYRTTKESAG